ncbi:MAG: S1 RNA-binding domain-containing protein, partial [Lutibacter sp.]|nr:S1 RNA-binding domain-containing protein [Lutibacter sp.]
MSEETKNTEEQNDAPEVNQTAAKAQTETPEEVTETVEAPKAKEETTEEVVETVEAPKAEEVAEEAVVETPKVAKAPKAEKVAKEEVAETVEAPKVAKVNPEEFLANFDWHMFEEGIEAIDAENLKSFEAALEVTLGIVSEREVIEGVVIRKTDREVIIDINAKSEGVISLNEFRYNPNLAVGDKVEVLVDKREDNTGQLVLSHKKARVIKAWDRVNNAHETGEVV